MKSKSLFLLLSALSVLGAPVAPLLAADPPSDPPVSIEEYDRLRAQVAAMRAELERLRSQSEKDRAKVHKLESKHASSQPVTSAHDPRTLDYGTPAAAAAPAATAEGPGNAASAGGGVNVDPLPLPVAAASPGTVGYFPTYQESKLLGSWQSDVGRNDSEPVGAPDAGRFFHGGTAGSGGSFWFYEPGMNNPNWIQSASAGLDTIFRYATPGQTTVIQSPYSEYSWFQMGATFPFLTQNLYPDETTSADVLGVLHNRENGQYVPLYFDLLDVSALALYDKVSGPGSVGIPDGWLSDIAFDIRAGLALTPETSLVVHGRIDVVLAQKQGVAAYLEAGDMSGFANLNLQAEWGKWDVRFFDNLVPFTTRDFLYWETLHPYSESSGMFTVGIPQTTLAGGAFWDRDYSYLTNQVGATAGAFLNEDLRFLAGIGENDTWPDSDFFGGHVSTEYLSAGIFYDGYGWWLAPSLTYMMTLEDYGEPESLLMLNFTAPLAVNLLATGSVGYSFGNIVDGLAWRIGLDYDQSDRLHHSLYYAEGYQDLKFGNYFFGQDVGYQIAYSLGPRTQLGLATHWYHDYDSKEDLFDLGASATVALGDYSSIQFFAAYLDYHQPPYGSDLPPTALTTVNSQWLYSVTFSRLLATKLTADLTFELLQNFDNINSSYIQKIAYLRLTRNF